MCPAAQLSAAKLKVRVPTNQSTTVNTKCRSSLLPAWLLSEQRIGAARNSTHWKAGMRALVDLHKPNCLINVHVRTVRVLYWQSEPQYEGYVYVCTSSRRVENIERSKSSEPVITNDVVFSFGYTTALPSQGVSSSIGCQSLNGCKRP